MASICSFAGHPKQGPTLLEGRSPYSSSGVLS
jgi:hypothetical protein